MTEEKSELQVQLSRDEHDLVDMQKSLAEDEKFFQDMKAQCDTKTQEWQERSNMRLQEMTGISEAMDILQEDDEVVSFSRVMKAQGGADLPTGAPAMLVQTQPMLLQQQPLQQQTLQQAQ